MRRTRTTHVPDVVRRKGAHAVGRGTPHANVALCANRGVGESGEGGGGQRSKISGRINFNLSEMETFRKIGKIQKGLGKFGKI